MKKLIGKQITKVEGLEEGSQEVIFYCSDGTSYLMVHGQECCEVVSIEDISGDPESLIGSIVLDAYESSESYEDDEKDANGIGMWTFYRIVTLKDTIVIRWWGESNGYYSVGVDFDEIKPKKS